KQRGVLRPEDAKRAIRDTLLTSAGLYRDKESLLQGSTKLEAIQSEINLGLCAGTMREAIRALEASNMALVSKFIVISALVREESRGGHQRRDFPTRNDSRWLVHIQLQKTQSGTLFVDEIPIM